MYIFLINLTEKVEGVWVIQYNDARFHRKSSAENYLNEQYALLDLSTVRFQKTCEPCSNNFK